eukprot:1179053-Prorocentrum_minimum.AAC.1
MQNSQEQAPCATYWFLGLIQVPHEGPEGGQRGARGGPERVHVSRRSYHPHLQLGLHTAIRRP